MSSPEGVRDTLAAHLAASLTDVDVTSNPRAVIPVQRPAIVVTIRVVTNADIACPSRRVALDVWSISAMVDDNGPADDDVDQLVGRTLDALDLAPRTSWSTSTRTVWLDSQPCYRTECEVVAS